MVVLTNNQSASASEIVAACLQDHQRAKIVGMRSYGKGTVQNLIELENGRSALKLTTASYWRPSERNIHRLKDAKEEDDWGVRPDKDFQVKVDEDQWKSIVEWRTTRGILRHKAIATKPVENVDDPQLNKAVEYLEKQIAKREKQNK